VRAELVTGVGGGDVGRAADGAAGGACWRPPAAGADRHQRGSRQEGALPEVRIDSGSVVVDHDVC